MKLHNTNLVIHIGDKVGFFTGTKDNESAYMTGIVKGVISDDELTVRVEVNEFLMCTIAVANISRINNLFISLNNFRDNLKISIGV